MDTISFLSVDSGIQQLVINIERDDGQPPKVEYSGEHEQLMLLRIDPDRVGNMRVLLCREPQNWVNNNSCSDHGFSMDKDTPWIDVTEQPAARILSFFDWAYHSLGRNGDENQVRVNAFRTLENGDTCLQVYMWTATNVYSIVGRIGRHKTDSFLGASISSRMARPGEDWTRGNDLASGPFTLATWTNIVFDILGSEIQNTNTRRYRYEIEDVGPSRNLPYGRRGMVRYDRKRPNDSGTPFCP